MGYTYLKLNKHFKELIKVRDFKYLLLDNTERNCLHILIEKKQKALNLYNIFLNYKIKVELGLDSYYFYKKRSNKTIQNAINKLVKYNFVWKKNNYYFVNPHFFFEWRIYRAKLCIGLRKGEIDIDFLTTIDWDFFRLKEKEIKNKREKNKEK
jgi:hypothetical protein